MLAKDNDFSDAAAKALDKQWWNKFSTVLATREMAKAWVKLLDASTGKRYNETLTPNIKFLLRMDLSRDISGYQIGPLTDNDKKWYAVTWQPPRFTELRNIALRFSKPDNMGI